MSATDQACGRLQGCLSPRCHGHGAALPGLKDKWQCKLMVSPTGRGGARGPGDGAIAPYAGFAKDAARKDFGVMSKNIGEWGAQACTGPSALSCGL